MRPSRLLHLTLEVLLLLRNYGLPALISLLPFIGAQDAEELLKFSYMLFLLIRDMLENLLSPCVAGGHNMRLVHDYGLKLSGDINAEGLYKLVGCHLLRDISDKGIP